MPAYVLGPDLPVARRECPLPHLNTMAFSFCLSICRPSLPVGTSGGADVGDASGGRAH
jgi:hypothetical protein